MVNINSGFSTLVIENFEADRTADVGKSEDCIWVKEFCLLKKIVGYKTEANIDHNLC